jgi:uncharacterized protein with von Willebrand factor type A (vWA) domain
MKPLHRAIRYSRWDGRQTEFSMDVKGALDALSDLMMEGLNAREALEWMRQRGFELGGLNMRVMGADELARDLRDQARELFDRFDMSQATDEMRQRLDEILDREQQAQVDRHGHESASMNEFMQRRHAEDQRTSQAIERFRDHDWADAEAGEDFQELLEEAEALGQLERFLDEQESRFRGDEVADYETAQDVRAQIEALQQMAQALENGDFEQVSPEQLREMLGDPAAQSFILIRDLESNFSREGLLRDGDLTPRAIRKIGASALADVYNELRKGLRGEHDTKNRGAATPRPDETRPWAFGDPLDLDIVKTVMNGVRRGGARTCEETGARRVQLEVEDFEVREMDYSSQTTTVLLLDMSWSMSWADRFPAAKRVALAMDQLVRTRFPRDHFAVVGFSTRARELKIRELPEVCWDMGDPFTNLQEGLMVAEDLLRRFPCSSPQIIVITDGQPTAYFEQGQLRVEWPMGMGGISPHAVAETLKQVKRITQQGATINTFMLDDAPELVGFVERMTQINRGRAFYTQPNQLGSFLMVDYISQRRVRRS